MKPLIAAILLATFVLFYKPAIAQSNNTTDKAEQYSGYFKEIKIACVKAQKLWGINTLYSAILLVDPKTREIFANNADSAGSLKPLGKIYYGQLPSAINIANTTIKWNGTQWAMVMLPLADDKDARINLLAHELFHKAQKGLGFIMYNPDNNHLDKKDGRIYLRLELEALKKALLAKSDAAVKTHLQNAITFRKLRYSQFKNADSTENLLELNEGIAEYTGITVANRTKENNITHLTEAISSFMLNPTYVRSFAYHTIPVYGYFMRQKKRLWNRSVTSKTNLTSFIVQALAIEVNKNITGYTSEQAEQYQSKKIIEEESKREEEIQKRIAAYKKEFTESPYLKLKFEQMNVSFDPRNIMPIDNLGTVYPNIRITDKWGILTVTEGALLSSNWDYIIVSKPTSITAQKVEGKGWTLEISENYFVEEDSNTKNYVLKKK